MCGAIVGIRVIRFENGYGSANYQTTQYEKGKRIRDHAAEYAAKKDERNARKRAQYLAAKEKP